MIQDICLIPLHDGNWTSARGQSIFLSKGETSLKIPSGIEVLIVDSSAESDLHRRKLFMSLGVKAWEAPEICRLVLRIHGSSNFEPKTLAVDQLISHAAFLYNASWQPPKTADLWFATMQDERCLGRNLYIPGSTGTDSSAARIFAQLQKQSAVIHDGYLKAFASDADWPNWVVSNLGLSMVPRLINPHVDPKPQPTQTLGIHENATALEHFNFDEFLATETVTPPITQKSVALEDYHRQLMLLEQQNKKWLLTARQEPQTPSPTQSMTISISEAQALQRLAQRQQQATQQGTPKASKPKGEFSAMSLSLRSD